MFDPLGDGLFPRIKVDNSWNLVPPEYPPLSSSSSDD